MSSTTTRPAAGTAGRDVALVAVFAALIAVFGLVPGINLSFGVPIVLQNLMIMLAGCVLGMRRGFLATLVFVLLCLVGLPLLPNGRTGMVALAGPSVGYFLSYPFVAALIGFLAERRAPNPPAWWLVVANLLGGVVLCHLAGIAGMAARLHASLGKAAGLDAAFVPGDVVKAVVAAGIAAAVHRSVPGLLTRR